MVMAIENFKNYDQFFANFSNFDSLKTQNANIVCSKSHFFCIKIFFSSKNINILNINWLQKNMFFNTKKL